MKDPIEPGQVELRAIGGEPPRSLWQRSWVWILLLSCWLYLFTYSFSLNNPNERTRVLQARAIVEYGRLSIGEKFLDSSGRMRVRDLYGNVYDGIFVNDVSLSCREKSKTPPDCEGWIYPAKAPGAALLGVPALAVVRLFGGLKSGPSGEAFATWVVRYFGIAIWMLVGMLAFHHLLLMAGLPLRGRQGALLTAGLGTGIFPYAIMFVGHALAGGLLVLGISFLIRSQEDSRRRFLWALIAGLVTSFAVCLEYHSVLAVACVGVWVLFLHPRRLIWTGFGLGALAILLVYIMLHMAMFDHPLASGHFFLLSAHNRASQATGFLGLGRPHWGALRDHLFDPYMGLLPLMPWLVVGCVVGIPRLLRGSYGNLPRGAGRVLVGIVLVYLILVICMEQWRVMNGWSIGPRYLVPAMLPMAVVAAIGWHWLIGWNKWIGPIMAGLAVASVVMVAALTAVYPQPPWELRNPFGELAVPLLLHGYGVRNLGLVLGLGPFSLIPFGGLIAAVVASLCRRKENFQLRKMIHFGLTILIAIAWVLVMGSMRLSSPEARSGAQQFAKNTGEGARP